MLSMRGMRGLGAALLVGLFAGCSSSNSDEPGQATAADTAGANLKAVNQKTNSLSSG